MLIYLFGAMTLTLDLEGQDHILFPIVDYMSAYVKNTTSMFWSSDIGPGTL